MSLFPQWFFIVFMIFTLHSYSAVLIDFGSSWNFQKGSDFKIAHAGEWQKPSYDESNWTQGTMPFRYGDGSGGKTLSDMIGTYTTVYLRKKVHIDSWANLDELLISLNYDDGISIWINNKLVVSENASSDDRPTAVALGQHEFGTIEVKTLTEPQSYLVLGENTIAVLGYNVNLPSSDFYLDLKLEGRAILPASKPLVFSHSRGFYSKPFNLVLASSASNV